MTLARTANHEQMISYIEATLTGGSTKKAAYLTYINPNIVDVNQALNLMEKSSEFQAVYATIVDNSDIAIAAKLRTVQNKYISMVEKNIDTAVDILDKVADDDNYTITDKATAVRLVNETIGAMAIVGSTSTPQDPGKLDRSGAVQ